VASRIRRLSGRRKVYANLTDTAKCRDRCEESAVTPPVVDRAVPATGFDGDRVSPTSAVQWLSKRRHGGVRLPIRTNRLDRPIGWVLTGAGPDMISPADRTFLAECHASGDQSVPHRHTIPIGRSRRSSVLVVGHRHDAARQPTEQPRWGHRRHRNRLPARRGRPPARDRLFASISTTSLVSVRFARPSRRPAETPYSGLPPRAMW